MHIDWLKNDTQRKGHYPAFGCSTDPELDIVAQLTASVLIANGINQKHLSRIGICSDRMNRSEPLGLFKARVRLLKPTITTGHNTSDSPLKLHTEKKLQTGLIRYIHPLADQVEDNSDTIFPAQEEDVHVQSYFVAVVV